jgi:DNA polymerase III alpha subunit
MKKDEYGNVIYQEHDIFKLLYQNVNDFNGITVEDTDDIRNFVECIEQDIKFYEKPAVSIEDFDKEHQRIWFIPDHYKSFDIYQYCQEKCINNEQRVRCAAELELFNELHMIELFPVLKYIIDTLREHNVIWGVGRGSSTASYVLYLLGVHKIDSIKYELDYKEFLRKG